MSEHKYIVNSEIASGLDVIGDRWTLLILRDCFLGRSRFEEFRRYTGISKATLSRRLECLVAEDILHKRPYGQSSKRVEYKLSEKGSRLFPISLLAWQWEMEWTSGEQFQASSNLYHLECSQPLSPMAVCRKCNEQLLVSEVSLPVMAENSTGQLAAFKSLNKMRRVRSTDLQEAKDDRLLSISDLIGDRWTLLILIASFLGVKRNDGYQQQLNIASNILSARLNLLVKTGVFEKRLYQNKPPRSEYILTDKGRSLFPIIMAMRQWVVDGLSKTDLSKTDQSLELIHQPCGNPLAIDVQCKSCHSQPGLTDVGLESVASR